MNMIITLVNDTAKIIAVKGDITCKGLMDAIYEIAGNKPVSMLNDLMNYKIVQVRSANTGYIDDSCKDGICETCKD